VVIALFKDIPDIKGDTQAGVRTFSVRMGAARVFWICIGLLLAAYAGGVAYGANMLLTQQGAAAAGAVVVGGHAAMAALLWARARAVATDRQQELTSAYMFIWKLFYAEYLLIPFLA
jgi:homogentisate phytyltransferase/homogentisate geranylgeranyltransferase